MESPDAVYGRMKEGAHLAGYSAQRAIENLRWLLEDSRYEQLSEGYGNVNDFLRDTQKAFSLLNIKPEERKQIAELVKELQPKASQRAIAEMVGASKETIARDLGNRNGTNVTKYNENKAEIGTNVTPAIPPDDFDPIARERKERAREEKRQEIQSNHAKKRSQSIPDGKYQIIYADPPWEYKNSGFDEAADNQYPTMPLQDICSLPMGGLATDTSVLFLWATNPLLLEAVQVMEAWGFEYKTNIVWVKDRGRGKGWYLKSKHELLLIGVRSNSPQPAERPDSAQYAVRGNVHSRKPELFYELIEQMYPEGKKIELFARNTREGWDSWGNEW